jgi:DNA polymerase-3 subunit alpha
LIPPPDGGFVFLKIHQPEMETLFYPPDPADVPALPEKWGSQRYIFVDTETTGLPLSWQADLQDTSAWPRLVQLAWILTDEKNQLIDFRNDIIYPEGFSIPRRVSKIHGITTIKARKQGKKLFDVLNPFLEVLTTANFLVAHNLRFDASVLISELYRAGQDPHRVLELWQNPFSGLDTMQLGTAVCKIPAKKPEYGEFKFPSLQELYFHLFGKPGFENAHQADQDVQICRLCFFKMLNENLISLPKEPKK